MLTQRQAVDALIEAAKGRSFHVVRDSSGRFRRAEPTEPLGAGEALLEVWDRDPDPEAFAVLMDLALGDSLSGHRMRYYA